MLSRLLLIGLFAGLVLSQTSSYAFKAISSMETYQGFTWPGWVVDANFGTPEQKLDVLLDGGIDLFYLFTTNCTQHGCGLNPFDPYQSSTMKVINDDFSYTYGAGQIIVNGSVVTDNGSFGSINVMKQQFAVVDYLQEPSTYPESSFMSGVFGFAYPTSEWGSLSIIEGIANQNNVSAILSFWLPDNMYDSGIVTIGNPDSSLYTGAINYVPLLPSTWAKRNYPFFWTNTISDIKVNGVSNGYCGKRHDCNFFIDLAARPMDLSNAIPTINVAPDCSNINTLSNYTLTIGGVDYTLTPDDYVLKVVEGNNKITCESGIFSGGHVPYPFTLGYTFIRNFYTVLDFENSRLGFAPAANQNTNK